MDIVVPDSEKFIWPDGLFTLPPNERKDYNERVREFMLNYLLVFPEVRAKYLEERVQQIVFEDNEEEVFRSELARHVVYNIPLPYYDSQVAERIVGYLRAVTTNVLLVNFSFSFIHSTLEPDVYMFKYASHNTQIMSSYMRILTVQDTDDLLPYLQPETVGNRIHHQLLEKYGYCIAALTSVKVDILEHTLTIGILDNNNHHDQPYVCSFTEAPDDGKCVWRALAAHILQTDNYWGAIRDYTEEIIATARSYMLMFDGDEYKFDIRKTAALEDAFRLNVVWYHHDGFVIPANYSTKRYNTRAPLLLIGQHCTYIFNLQLFLSSRCSCLTTHITPTAKSFLVGCGNWFQQHYDGYNNSKKVWTFPRSPTDGKCFIRCLAAAIIGEPTRSLALTQLIETMLNEARTLGLTLPNNHNQLDIDKTRAIEEWCLYRIRYHEISSSISLKKYIKTIRYSDQRFTTTLHLLVSSEDSACRHFAYVKDWKGFSKNYMCSKCKKIFAPGTSIFAHKQRCVGLEDKKKWKFLTGVDRPRPDMFSKLKHLVTHARRVETEPRFVFFDIECTLSQPDETHFGIRELKAIEQEHVPVSIALAYSASSWEVNDPQCLVTNGNTEALVEQFYTALNNIYDQRHAYLQYYDYKETFRALMTLANTLETHIPPSERIAITLVRHFWFDYTRDEGYHSPTRLEEATFYLPKNNDIACIDDDDDDDRYVSGDEWQNDDGDDNEGEIRDVDDSGNFLLKRQLKIIYGLLRYYDTVAYRLNVVGYNSSKYDLNALRPWLIPLMLRNGGKLEAVKRQQRYLVLTNKKFRFTDIYLFMAPHSKLTDFTKAYLRTEDAQELTFKNKLEFPYEYLSLKVLHETQMPPAEYFTSRKAYYECTNGAIKQQMYTEAVKKQTLAVQQFEQLKCKTLLDYLIIYNKADVSPAIKAIQNLVNIYVHTTKQNLFDFLTLPSLAKQTALSFTPAGGYFMRFTAKDAQLYHDVRDAITGGTSLVWTRLAEAGKTKIRPHEYGSLAETVQRIIGLDMSGCYLYATSQEHLTGPYFLRTFGNGFKIESPLRNIHAVLAIEWYVVQRFGMNALPHLIHEYAGGEKQLMMPDGHVWSVDGFLEQPGGMTYVIEYHGCWWHNHQVNDGCVLPHAENAKHNKNFEAERHRQIQQQVTEVIVLRECLWYREMRTASAKFFLNSRPLYHTWLMRKGMSKRDILSLVMANKLKGLFEVDAYVSVRHRDDFRDVLPFFYQKDVTWDMIGNHMRYQMSVANRKFTSRRLLLNPPFCEKLFITHFYLKWLLDKKVVIHHIHRIIEYPLCSAPFSALGEMICRERQKAAAQNATETDKASGDAWKLIGNSIYGQFCMQPDNYTETKFCNENQMIHLTNLRKSVQVDCLGPDSFEATFVKNRVTVKQCPQMAVAVYQHAKLRMLAFEYELSRILDRRKYCLMLTDTDSYYFALAHATWEQCVQADVTPESVETFKKTYFSTSPETSKYMGLFHKEFEGIVLVALQPKMYYALSATNVPKTATRGIKKRDNPLNIEIFKHILESVPKCPIDLDAIDEAEQQQQQLPPLQPYTPYIITQRTFKIVNKRMVTVKTTTSALNAFYIKRKVLANNVDTEQLDWKWPLEFNK